MSQSTPRKRNGAVSLLLALSMMLTGCFVTPGQFDSTLTLNRDESFSFSYEGEIFFLGLSQLAMMGSNSEETYEADGCFDEDTYEDRECTAAEIAEQEAEWQAGAEERRLKREQEAKQMAQMMGGIDPTDPEAGNELAQKLARQRGWESVEYAGDGLFNVRYAVSGRLTHDLTFPILEGVPVPSPFVQVILRDEGKVRVNAPGFTASEGNNPMSGLMMGGMAGGMAAAMSEGANAEESGGAMPGVPMMDGTFRIITNGSILANNTDEGPVGGVSAQTLTWNVSLKTAAAPTALIHLAQ
ncbi:hypothetical protein GRI43_05940 [Altererythrobacter luteolus]|uniref:Lipoprotein n=1 Tax=Pontixanthobacter luteolus TaxID=295089 RepID=A0A6I4UY98_9SPHN|nr:hypothetical protein [Pontixanthobacter luteolus]MXP46929.1 hypothetical protein [Pontixanthobacter luteolus]